MSHGDPPAQDAAVREAAEAHAARQQQAVLAKEYTDKYQAELMAHAADVSSAQVFLSF